MRKPLVAITQQGWTRKPLFHESGRIQLPFFKPLCTEHNWYFTRAPCLRLLYSLICCCRLNGLGFRTLFKGTSAAVKSFTETPFQKVSDFIFLRRDFKNESTTDLNRSKSYQPVTVAMQCLCCSLLSSNLSWCCHAMTFFEHAHGEQNGFLEVEHSQNYANAQRSSLI